MSHSKKEKNKKIEKCNWIPPGVPKGDEESIQKKKKNGLTWCKDCNLKQRKDKGQGHI